MAGLLALVVVLALVATAAWWFTLRPTGPKHPSHWDPRVAPIAAFVERTRQLKYEHPVYVDFLTPAEYRTATQGGADAPSEPSAAVRTQADQEVAQFRAIGLVQGKVDLVAALREQQDSGTLAFYSPEKERVFVRGTALTPDLRVTLAHELTHALQDQHFDIKRINRLSGVADTELRSVLEGDASVVETSYADDVLTAAERKSYETTQQQESTDAQAKLAHTVPDVIQAGAQVPYLFGPSFVDVVKKVDGYAGVNAAINTAPTSLKQITDPLVYLAHTPPKQVAPVPLPKGATRLDSGPFGSIEWFLMLSERIEPRRALSAVDGWGGDAMLTYTERGRVCVAGRFVGTATADTQRMTAALREWATAMPANHPTVTEAGGVSSFVACDPGASAKLGVTGRSTKALVYPTARIQFLASAIDQGVPQARASCLSHAVVDNLTLANLTDEHFAESSGFALVVQRARAICG